MHAHLFLYDFGVMTLEHTGLNGGKVSDWLKPSWTLPCNKSTVFDYLTPILDLSMVTQSMALLSLEVQRETNSRSSQEREAVLLLHDICKNIYSLCTFYINQSLVIKNLVLEKDTTSHDKKHIFKLLWMDVLQNRNLPPIVK